MPIRCLSVMVVTLIALGAPVRADEKSHRAAALELCEVTHMERSMQESMRRMMELQIQQTPQLAQARPQLLKFFEKYLSWGSMKEDFIKLYQQSFSEQELREIIAFYKTPTGQKSVLQMPILLQRGAEIGSARVREHLPELMEMMQAAAKQGGRETGDGVKAKPVARPIADKPGAAQQ
jgi:uncharacterized protein